MEFECGDRTMELAGFSAEDGTPLVKTIAPHNRISTAHAANPKERAALEEAKLTREVNVTLFQQR